MGIPGELYVGVWMRYIHCLYNMVPIIYTIVLPTPLEWDMAPRETEERKWPRGILLMSDIWVASASAQHLHYNLAQHSSGYQHV